MASGNESEKRETLVDIVEEMRTRSREVKEAFGGRPDGVENILDIWADRIEAIDSADAWRSLYTPGNAAAMHEALEKIYSCAIGCNNYNLDIAMDKVIEIAKAALSAPPRNCDLPLVVNGPANNNADKAWLVFKHSNSDAYFDVSGLLRCIDWLFATAAERKGDGDGR